MPGEPNGAKIVIALLVIMVIFVIHSQSMDFIQDDAFISFRYVQNFINGRGLVFNPGERVEGYTNFLWIMLLALFTRLGLDVILISKLLGVASGCATLFLLYKISTFVFLKEKESKGHTGSSKSHAANQSQKVIAPGWLFALAPPLLLALNGSFAYWSTSGLETTFFTVMVLLAVYAYFTDEKLAIVFAAISSLIRPEGVLIFAIIMAHKFLFQRDSFKHCLSHVVGFIVLLLPFLLFKTTYYGDLLPNPFYAKTGFSAEYWMTGLSYFWLFVKHYGLWGALYVIPLVTYRHLGVKGRVIPQLVFLYTFYIILMGGDVLQAHRFFQPVLPFLYLLFGYALLKFFLKLKRGFTGRAIPIFLLVVFSALTFLLPRTWLLNVRRLEVGLCQKMAFKARILRETFGSNFTLAVSTIGAISYYTGAKVIDMLGLTDPYIAKHPERVPGIVSTWKEKRFNTRYLLSQNPDVIMFSTGAKPSAPAERALYLNSKFRNNYYHYYFPIDNFLLNIFRRKGEYPHENRLFADARFVNVYNEALNLENNHQFLAAAKKFEDLFLVAPPDFSWAYDNMAFLQWQMGDIEEARKYARRAIEMDNYCAMSHFILHRFSMAEGDTLAAQHHRKEILRINPELLNMKLR